MDYIFRRLALDYSTFEDRSMLGIYSAEHRQRQLETGSYEPLEEAGGASELISDQVEATVVEDASPVVEVRAPATLETPEAKAETSTPVESRRQAHHRPHQGRAPRADHRHRRRLPALHDLRDQDAPGR